MGVIKHKDPITGRWRKTGTAAAITGGVIEPDPRELYQRVESLTSDQESWIITDFYADNTCGVELIASFPTLVDRVPMGSREDTGATRFYCVYPLSASSCYYGFNNGSTISCALKVDTIYRMQTNFMDSRLVNILTEDGIRLGGATISATLIDHTAPIAIFGYNLASTGNVSSRRACTVYRARCSRSGGITREYLPCRRKSDGALGVYETFTKSFTGNAGTGAFTAGPDIDWD